MDEAEAEWAPALRRLVRLALVEQDWSDADLARALDWKPQRLSNYLKGLRRPGIREVFAMSEALPALDFGEALRTITDADDDGELGTAIAEMLLNEFTASQLAALSDALAGSGAQPIKLKVNHLRAAADAQGENLTEVTTEANRAAKKAVAGKPGRPKGPK